MTDNSSKRCTRAYSSSELIIALVILLVVAAILIPVFARAQEQSRQASCLSMEEELGLAFFQYFEDYDGKFPCGTHPAPQQSLPVGWAGQINPYTLNARRFKCFDDPTEADKKNSFLMPISYAYNENVGHIADLHGRSGKKTPLINPAKQSDLLLPSRTVLLCEIEGVTCDIYSQTGKEASSPAVLGNSKLVMSNIDGSERSMRYATGILRSDPASAVVIGTAYGSATASTGRHNEGSNFLFTDGHAKWLRSTEVSAGLTNNVSSKDCTAGQSLSPVGKAGPGYAAGTGCSDAAIRATFSIK